MWIICIHIFQGLELSIFIRLFQSFWRVLILDWRSRKHRDTERRKWPNTDRSMHWAARQAVVRISFTWLCQLEASSLLSQRSMLLDWSLQASTSLIRLSCRILYLWQTIECITATVNTPPPKMNHVWISFETFGWTISITKFPIYWIIQVKQTIPPYNLTANNLPMFYKVSIVYEHFYKIISFF